MSRKDEDEKEAAKKPATKSTKEEAPQPTNISGLPAEDYLTEQEKLVAAGTPLAPTDEAAAPAKAKKE